MKKIKEKSSGFGDNLGWLILYLVLLSVCTIPMTMSGAIEAFTNGGTVKWKSASDCRVGGLTTSRTIWGQSFDGTANVSGNLTLNKDNQIIFYGKNNNTSPKAQMGY